MARTQQTRNKRLPFDDPNRMTLPFDLTPLAALWLAVAILVASFVRGYSGFGFTAIIVTAASLVTDPLHLVPVVIIADICLTVQMARGVWVHIDWRRVWLLALGTAVGVPLGVWAIAQVGGDTARAVISVYILIMCGVLLAGWRMAQSAGPTAHIATGAIAGLANGAAVGGLPVAAFFAAQPIPAATFRATLVAFFTIMDLGTLPTMGLFGMITTETWIATAMGLPLMILGVSLGTRQFLHANPQGFRRFAIFLLAALALMGLGRSLL